MGEKPEKFSNLEFTKGLLEVNERSDNSIRIPFGMDLNTFLPFLITLKSDDSIHYFKKRDFSMNSMLISFMVVNFVTRGLFEVKEQLQV